MNQTQSKSRIKSRISKAGSTEAVSFTDGMLVTAEDLNSAMHYPLAVVQILLRSYFGCGIVCGLEVSDPNRGRRPRQSSEQAQQAEARQPSHQKPTQTSKDADGECTPERGFIVQVAPGVALGCDGYPIELCEPVRLDLSPDPCGCPLEAETMRFIAIRRITAPEAPSRGCGCGPASDPGQQCSRVRDHVVVEAFDRMPDGICMENPSRYGNPGAAREESGTCACLKHCSTCDRCAEPWVLLATVRIDAEGVVPGGINGAEDVRDHGGPTYVKPIRCVCSNETDRPELYEDLLARIDRLERMQVAPPPPPLPPPPPPPPPPGRAVGDVGDPGRIRDAGGLADETIGDVQHPGGLRDVDHVRDENVGIRNLGTTGNDHKEDVSPAAPAPAPAPKKAAAKRSSKPPA